MLHLSRFPRQLQHTVFGSQTNLSTLQTMTAVHKAWWKEACVFQVYPSSFADAKGTGLGNLAGITSKVDYLKDLGVDVLWMR